MEALRKNTARKSFATNICSVHIEKLPVTEIGLDLHKAVKMEHTIKLNPSVIDRLKLRPVESVTTNNDSGCTYNIASCLTYSKVKVKNHVKQSSSTSRQSNSKGHTDKHCTPIDKDSIRTSISNKHRDNDSKVSSAHKSKSHPSIKHKDHHKKDHPEKARNSKSSHKVSGTVNDPCDYAILEVVSKSKTKSNIHSKDTKHSAAKEFIKESLGKDQHVKIISKENIKESHAHKQSARNASSNCSKEKQDKNKICSSVESLSDRKCLKEANTCLKTISSSISNIHSTMKRKHDSLSEKDSSKTCKSHKDRSSHKKHKKSDQTSIKSSEGNASYSSRSTTSKHTVDSHEVSFTECQANPKTASGSTELSKSKNSLVENSCASNLNTRMKQGSIGELGRGSVDNPSMKVQSEDLASLVALSSSPCRSGTKHNIDIVEMEDNQISDAKNYHSCDSDTEHTICYSDNELDDSVLPSVAKLLSPPNKLNMDSKTVTETEYDDECKDILNNELSHIMIVDSFEVNNNFSDKIGNNSNKDSILSISNHDVRDTNAKDDTIEIEIDVADQSELMFETHVAQSDRQKQDVLLISENCTVSEMSFTAENKQSQQQQSNDMLNKDLEHQLVVINSEDNDTGLVITSVVSQLISSNSGRPELTIDEDRYKVIKRSSVEHKKCHNLFNVNPHNSVTHETVTQEPSPETSFNAWSQSSTNTLTDSNNDSIGISGVFDNHKDVCDQASKQASEFDNKSQSEKVTPENNHYPLRAALTQSDDGHIPSWVTVQETFVPMKTDPPNNSSSVVMISPRKRNTENNDAYSRTTTENTFSDKNRAGVSNNHQEWTPPQRGTSPDVQNPPHVLSQTTGLNTVCGIQLPDLVTKSPECSKVDDALCSFVSSQHDAFQNHDKAVTPLAPNIHKETRKRKSKSGTSRARGRHYTSDSSSSDHGHLSMPIPIMHKKLTSVGRELITLGRLQPTLFSVYPFMCIECNHCNQMMSPLIFMKHYDNLPAGLEILDRQSLCKPIEWVGDLDSIQAEQWNEFCRNLKKSKHLHGFDVETPTCQANDDIQTPCSGASNTRMNTSNSSMSPLVQRFPEQHCPSSALSSNADVLTKTDKSTLNPFKRRSDYTNSVSPVFERNRRVSGNPQTTHSSVNSHLPAILTSPPEFAVHETEVPTQPSLLKRPLIQQFNILQTLNSPPYVHHMSRYSPPSHPSNFNADRNKGMCFGNTVPRFSHNTPQGLPSNIMPHLPLSSQRNMRSEMYPHMTTGPNGMQTLMHSPPFNMMKSPNQHFMYPPIQPVRCTYPDNTSRTPLDIRSPTGANDHMTCNVNSNSTDFLNGGRSLVNIPDPHRIVCDTDDRTWLIDENSSQTQTGKDSDVNRLEFTENGLSTDTPSEQRMCPDSSDGSMVTPIVPDEFGSYRSFTGMLATTGRLPPLSENASSSSPPADTNSNGPPHSQGGPPPLSENASSSSPPTDTNNNGLPHGQDWLSLFMRSREIESYAIGRIYGDLKTVHEQNLTLQQDVSHMKEANVSLRHDLSQVQTTVSLLRAEITALKQRH